MYSVKEIFYSLQGEGLKPDERPFSCGLVDVICGMVGNQTD